LLRINCGFCKQISSSSSSVVYRRKRCPDFIPISCLSLSVVLRRSCWVICATLVSGAIHLSCCSCNTVLARSFCAVESVPLKRCARVFIFGHLCRLFLVQSCKAWRKCWIHVKLWQAHREVCQSLHKSFQCLSKADCLDTWNTASMCLIDNIAL
jgi:hypothetical protein